MCRHVDFFAVLFIALGFVAISNARRIIGVPPLAPASLHNVARQDACPLDRALASLDSALQSIR